MQQQQQQGSQYAAATSGGGGGGSGVSPEMVSFGSTPAGTQMLAGAGVGGEAEAASPISSRPPASVNFEDMVGGSGAGDELDDADRGGKSSGGGGNRWPRQETLALLKIRSEMDVSFRDATLKGPLWDEVSRKLAELGYVRSAKKCKEKFENVHKYYKRTKEGRAGRQDGKSYRFFSQLEALQGAAGSGGSGSMSLPPSGPHTTVVSSAPGAASVGNIQFATPVSVGIVGSGGNSGGVMPRGVVPSLQPFTMYSSMGTGVPGSMAAPVSVMAPAPALAPVGISFSSDSSSSGSFESDEEEEEVDDMSEEERPASKLGGSGQKRKRGFSSSSKGGGKRRMMEFFEGLMKRVMQKQETMQQRFLETIEKREQERMIREEAWKRQEAVRLSHENELMAQERAIAASRDAAIVSFLHKITGQTIQLPQPVSTPAHHAAVPPPPHTAPTMAPAPAPTHISNPPPSRQQFQQQQQLQKPQQQLQQPQNTEVTRHQQMPPPSTDAIMAIPERQVPPQDPASGGGGSKSEPASSRWPKIEVLALIKLRSNLENRYQEAGPKGPLWEEISAGMHQMGYNRSSKRCKEKWENINKYFKKVKESNKKRPEDAKTCPYFNELDALYQKKILGGGNIGSSSSVVPFQQQPQQHQPQQVFAPEQPATVNNQETITSNPGTTSDQTKRDGTAPVQPNNGGLPENIVFGDQGNNTSVAGGPRKPEDIMMALMEQQQKQGQQQLNLEDYDQRMDDLGGSTDNLDDDRGGEEDESEEEHKMTYNIEFQRPSMKNKNGGNNGAPSFITMVQ